MQNKIKVIISDLDGTLLNHEHRISEYTKTVFQALHRKNYLLIVATGRHHLDALPIVDTLRCPVYLITSNGARIHSPQRELLFSHDISSKAIRSVLDLEIDEEFTTVLFKENVWLTNKQDVVINSAQTELNYLPELVNFDTLDDFSAIKLFFTHTHHSKLIALRDKIIAKYPDNFNHAFSLPLCLEFNDKSVDKSIAIAQVLEIENFNFQQSISFGDGYNDEKMLNACAFGLVMGNAPDSLKNKLSHLEVIAANDSDGVARFLSEKLL